MILQKFFNVLRGSDIDDEFYEELEENLIMADSGAAMSERLTEELKERVKTEKIKSTDDAKSTLKSIIKESMMTSANAYSAERGDSVYMIIGVNGVGKTTSCGKIAMKLKEAGRNVILVAADTFRAAAIEQLSEWGKRSGIRVIAKSEGSDPASVLFDACASAKAGNADTMVVDTAGRLHNKKNLMSELGKMNKILENEMPDANRETLLVLDATTGQNAIEQARQFNEVTDITGIILTKMDGTAKGGVAIPIMAELGIPIKYIGYGEKIDQLKKFNCEEYVNRLFDYSSD